MVAIISHFVAKPLLLPSGCSFRPLSGLFPWRPQSCNDLLAGSATAPIHLALQNQIQFPQTALHIPGFILLFLSSCHRSPVNPFFNLPFPTPLSGVSMTQTFIPQQAHFLRGYRALAWSRFWRLSSEHHSQPPLWSSEDMGDKQVNMSLYNV